MSYDCPAPDCDASFEQKKAALGHWAGMRDNDHNGSWAEANDQSTDSDASDTGSNPTMPDGPAETDTESDMVDLPCGHESYDESEAPDYPFIVTCDVCGESRRVTE